MDVMEKVFGGKKRKEAREAIYDAEIAASLSGVPVWNILENVNRSLRNPYLFRVIKQLQSGMPRYRAYAGILPKDVLLVLEMAAEKQIEIGVVFREYLALRKKIDEANRKLKSVLMGPTVSYVLYSLVVIGGLSLALTKYSEIEGLDVSSIVEMRNMYLYLFWIPVVILWVLLSKFPDKIPGWKSLYNFVVSAQYLVLTRILYDIGLSASDALDIMKKTEDRRIVERLRRISADEYNISGLSKVLSPYLDPVDRALLEMGVRMSREKEVIGSLVDRKMVAMDDRAKAISTFADKVSQVVIAVPIVFMAFAFIQLLSIVYAFRPA